jgi:threonine/homoserine efflux transporter RhtA
MNFNSFAIQPFIALVAGVLILIQPRLLNYIVAIYLIIVGVIGLAPGFR